MQPPQTGRRACDTDFPDRLLAKGPKTDNFPTFKEWLC